MNKEENIINLTLGKELKLSFSTKSLFPDRKDSFLREAGVLLKSFEIDGILSISKDENNINVYHCSDIQVIDDIKKDIINILEAEYKPLRYYFPEMGGEERQEFGYDFMDAASFFNIRTERFQYSNFSCTGYSCTRKEAYMIYKLLKRD